MKRETFDQAFRISSLIEDTKRELEKWEITDYTTAGLFSGLSFGGRTFYMVPEELFTQFKRSCIARLQESLGKLNAELEAI